MKGNAADVGAPIAAEMITLRDIEPSGQFHQLYGANVPVVTICPTLLECTTRKYTLLICSLLYTVRQ
jgi:hypothetical protein